MDDPQVLVSAKLPGFVPVNAMLEIVSPPLPLFVSVTVCAALVAPASCENESELTLSCTPGVVGGGEPAPLLPHPADNEISPIMVPTATKLVPREANVHLLINFRIELRAEY